VLPSPLGSLLKNENFEAKIPLFTKNAVLINHSFDKSYVLPTYRHLWAGPRKLKILKQKFHFLQRIQRKMQNIQ